MSFPIVTPSFYKEFADINNPEPDGFSEIILSPAAAECVLHINNPDVVRKLISITEPITFSISNAEGEAEEEMRKNRSGDMLDNPAAKYYWQLRELMMGVLQNKSVSFENRMLLLNYGMKTVQGMMDQNKPELIPRFTAEYTQGQISYDDVLNFFKGIPVNCPLSLSDGISFLKSLVKNDRGYRDVMNGVYKNLGVSGPETLSLIDMNKYLGMRRKYSEEFMNSCSNRAENIMVNFVWTYSIPFACSDRLNIWENFVFFNSLYNALKILITCSMPYGSDDDFVKTVSSFGSALLKAGNDAVWKTVSAVKNAGQATNGDMAILTIS